MGRFALSRRALLIAAALLASVVAACGGGGGGGGDGGGGGGGGGTPPTMSPTNTPPVGDTFAYTGTLTQSNVYTYPTPSPLPSTSASATVTLNAAVTSSAAPFGISTPHGGAYDLHYSESDAFPNVTNVSTTDSWQTTSTSAVDEYGSVVTYGSGSGADIIERSYSAPYLLDELPETNGASWTNAPTGALDETEPDGTDITRSVGSNGAYSETQGLVGGYNAVITENSDGSGTYGGTIWNAYGIEDFTYSAPSSDRITIGVTFTTPAPSSTATPEPPIVLATPVAWYPSSPVFYNETDSVSTGVTFPGSCNVAGTFGTSGNEIARTITTLDTILGYTEVQTYDEYDSATAGVVCIAMSDVQKYYYDYLDDTEQSYDDFATFAGGSTPLQTVTTNETVGLQSESLASSSTRRTVQSTSAQGLSMQQVGLAMASFQAKAEEVRLTRERKMIESIAARAALIRRGGAR